LSGDSPSVEAPNANPMKSVFRVIAAKVTLFVSVQLAAKTAARGLDLRLASA